MLKNRESFYKVCFDSMQVGILVWNSNEEIVLANVPASAMFGYDEDELLGAKCNKLFKIKEIFNNLQENLHTQIDTIGLTKEGLELPIEVNFGELVFENTHFYKALIVDISERKSAENLIVSRNYQLEDKMNHQNIELGKIIKQLNSSLTKESKLIQLIESLVVGDATGDYFIPGKTSGNSTVPKNSDFLNNLLKSKKVYHYKKGETIYCYGNQSNHIFLIKKGLVKTFKTNALGKELITNYFSDNQYFGYTFFINQQPHSENSAAINSTQLYKISRNEVKNLINDNPKVVYDFISLIGTNLSASKEKLLLLAFGSVRKKTAKTLLNLLKIYPTKNENEISISRGDLANSIGIAKETLIRTLHDLKEENLIKISAKNILIVDKVALSKIS